MALVDRYIGKVTLGMSDRRISTFEVRLKPDKAQLYINEVTQTLKDATEVGQLLLSIEDLSKGTLISKGIELKTLDDAADYPAPTAEVYAFDKLGVSFSAGFDNYQITIPARDEAKYVVGPDGLTVILTEAGGGTAEVEQFVERFAAVCLGKNGSAATVSQIRVVS